METTQRIMDALQNGGSLQEIVVRFPGESLSPVELEDLFSKAKVLGRSPVAHKLLVYLIQVSKDDWFNVRVLALLVQHAKDSAQDQTGRLVAMRKILDRIAKDLPDSGDPLTHYQKLNAFYYVLAARSRRDVGDTDRAMKWYETALGIYKELGLDPSVDKVVQEMQTLHVERRAFAITGVGRAEQSIPTLPEAEPGVIDLDQEEAEPVAEAAEPAGIIEPLPVEAQPAPEFGEVASSNLWRSEENKEPAPAEAQPAPEASEPVPAAAQPAPEASEPEPPASQPDLAIGDPVAVEPQPAFVVEAPAASEASEILPIPLAAPLAEEPQVDGSEDLGALHEETRLLQSRRDSLLIEVQDYGQQCSSLQAQATKTQKRLKALETRVKDQQRILEEKQALIQQMDRLTDQEVRLRQTLAQLEQQEQDQIKKLEALYNEARLLEKQVDILKRHAVAPPLIGEAENP